MTKSAKIQQQFSKALYNGNHTLAVAIYNEARDKPLFEALYVAQEYKCIVLGNVDHYAKYVLALPEVEGSRNLFRASLKQAIVIYNKNIIAFKQYGITDQFQKILFDHFQLAIDLFLQVFTDEAKLAYYLQEYYESSCKEFKESSAEIKYFVAEQELHVNKKIAQISYKLQKLYSQFQPSEVKKFYTLHDIIDSQLAEITETTAQLGKRITTYPAIFNTTDTKEANKLLVEVMQQLISISDKLKSVNAMDSITDIDLTETAATDLLGIIPNDFGH